MTRPKRPMGLPRRQATGYFGRVYCRCRHPWWFPLSVQLVSVLFYPFFLPLSMKMAQKNENFSDTDRRKPSQKMYIPETAEGKGLFTFQHMGALKFHAKRKNLPAVLGNGIQLLCQLFFLYKFPRNIKRLPQPFFIFSASFV